MKITEVRISNDQTIAERPNKRQHRLILQTSTGFGSDPKLQVAARLIDAEWTDEARPDPQPRACWQPTPKPTKKPRNGKQQTPAPAPEPPEISQAEEPLDALTLVLGSGAVLLGATVVAVYLIRRP